jgi:hypothetical protein
MKNYSILDQYLFELEKHLQDITPSDRSSIILDINQHIQDSLKNYPDQDLKQVLEDLGAPAKVANHYRLDRGLKLFKPSKHPIVKWMSITFISTFGIFLLFISIMIWKFTPIFEVNEKLGKIVFLGGLIDINMTSGKVKVLDEYHFTENTYTNQFEGAIDFPKEETDELVVNFKSGLFNFTNSLDDKLSWTCKLETPPTESFINQSGETVEIDLENYEGANCDFRVPSNIKLTVDGKEANITFTDAEYDIYVELNNGLVKFSPNPEVDYNYDLKVKKGMAADFFSVQDPKSFEVKIFIENGMITK